MQESGYKTTWYDGWFFAMFADRNAEKALHLNEAVRKFIADNTHLLDIGCGVGSLVYSLSDKCSSITAVDASPRMIRYARKYNQASNVQFCLVKTTTTLTELFSEQFDCAILKLVFHEMPEPDRQRLLAQAQSVARELVIVDWLAPLPQNMQGKMTWCIEWMAGRQHFANFKQWYSTGGIDGFLERNNLHSIQEERFVNKTGKIVKVRWN